MTFLDKLSSIAKDVGEKAGDAVEITKLKAKVGKEKDMIEDKLKKIGDFYHEKFTSGGEIDDSIESLCKEINEHNKAIEELQAQIAAKKE